MWEYRGRGWHLSTEPVHLEPPFIPFYRHGFPTAYIDDGKRPTWLSNIFRNEKPAGVSNIAPLLDYHTLEPFSYTTQPNFECVVVRFPRQRRQHTEGMRAFLTMLSNVETIVSFEIIATATEIRYQFVGSKDVIDSITTYFAAFFPEYRLQKDDAKIECYDSSLPGCVIDFGLAQEFVRPLHIASNKSFDPHVAIFAVLNQLGSEEHVVLQILFQPAQNPWVQSIVRSVTLHQGGSFFANAPEAPTLAKEKIASPLYGVTIRVLAQAKELSQATSLLNKLSHSVQQMSKSPHNELIPLQDDEYSYVDRVTDIHFRESLRLGMLLNLDELTTFVHFPNEHIDSKKLYADTRKTKPAPPIAQGHAYALGTNLHDGTIHTVTTSIDQRVRHTHIIGATGTGKSTLLAHCIRQDIEHGHAVVLLDPHGDLVEDVIATTPPELLNKIVLVDPTDREFPIGINVLEAHSEIEKELLSSDLVASFRKYATSWGDQMNAVLGNAILAILESTQGGSLYDLRRFLLETEFRKAVLHTVSDHSVLYYWHKEYPILKTNSIGSIVTRLDAFLRPKIIRNMVVQRTGLDFDQLLRNNNIIICKLSQGLIGKENSYVLGSLILSKIHQAIFRRQEQVDRSPVFLYIDEFQHFLTPSIIDMISGIRKYQAGLILSHQDLQQLQREGSELLNSVLNNAATRIVFRVGEVDAKKLQEGFSGFDAVDLQNLGKGEAVIRIEQPQFDCSLDTFTPFTVPDQHHVLNRESVIQRCRAQFASTRESVEAMFAESFTQAPPEFEQKDHTTEPVKPRQQSQPTITRTEGTQQNKKTESNTIKQPLDEREPAKEGYASPHRYLQHLVKQIAEEKGYVATLEALLPNGSGKVDVLLRKDSKTIAIEICHSTDPEWEAHNIEKCIQAEFSTIISLSGDAKQLEKIKAKCKEKITGFDLQPVHFYTPDQLISYFEEATQQSDTEPTVMKGYRVNLTYNSISKEEMARKQAMITKIVMDGLKKQKKKGG